MLDLETFNFYNDRLGRRPGSGPNEVWVSAQDEAAAEEALTQSLEGMGLTVEDTLVATEEIRRRVEQPLANASWGGLLALMFLALVLASASGVVLFSYVDTGERRTEFALLRTLGSSAGQVNGMVWFNLLLMVICGVAPGHLGRPADWRYPAAGAGGVRGRRPGYPAHGPGNQLAHPGRSLPGPWPPSPPPTWSGSPGSPPG